MIKINNNKMDVENISFRYGLVDSPEASIILKSTNIVKVCTKCKVEKVLDRFSKSKFGKFKVASECKECNKIYRESNKEYLKEIIKQSRKKNK